MHRTLARLIKRHFGKNGPPTEWAAFVQALDQTCATSDQAVAQAEHSLVVMSQELTERNEALRRESEEQKALLHRLEEAHHQLLQSEKMASIGQLAAGVAHEINNPIGFVSSNLKMLGDYVADLLKVIAAAQAEAPSLPAEAAQRFTQACQAADLDYLREDLTAMLRESREGIDRVKKIVQDLKDFSHSDEGHFTWADVHQGLESTLNIAANELKYRTDVIRDFGDLPMIECNLSQLNQVFMNLLVNAAQAMPHERRGKITVRTRPAGDEVCIEIEDDGSGIAPENLKRVFDPFFTTKPVGKGTGLGLSLSYGIVEKHHGHIALESTLGVGTRFTIRLPVHQPSAPGGH